MSFVRHYAALAAAGLVAVAILPPGDAEARGRNFGRNAAIAGAIGIGILAAGAAAAASRRPDYDRSYGDQGYGHSGYGYSGYGNPAYAEPTYAEPAYGYDDEEAPVYYQPQRRWQGYRTGPNPTAGTVDPARGSR